MNTTTDSLDSRRFDVREISCRVKHAQIFQRWLDLPTGDHFILVNDHDPVPLYYQFDAQFTNSFSWEYLMRGPEEFQVKITKLVPVCAPDPTGAPASLVREVLTSATTEEQQLDVRGLEPPEPLIRILDALESLPADARLRAITDREPCHLFGEAEARGFRHNCKGQPDGSWVTVLERA
jgi:uncharacterized protein (DUF2249 family)